MVNSFPSFHPTYSNLSGSGTSCTYDDYEYFNTSSNSSNTSTYYNWDNLYKDRDSYFRVLDYYADRYSATNPYTWVKNNYGFSYQPPDLKTRMRKLIQSRNAPVVLTSRRFLKESTDIREQKARETLLRVIGERKFKRFLKDGFISVKAKSGLVYQIFPGHDMTNVHKNGKKVEKLCVVMSGDFPPTDSLIMRYLLILNDEQDFRSHAIVHNVSTFVPKPKVKEMRSLNEVWKEMKKAA